MSFNYLCHLNAHGGSKEVIAFSNFFKKHCHSLEEKTALKYELDLLQKTSVRKSDLQAVLPTGYVILPNYMV